MIHFRYIKAGPVVAWLQCNRFLLTVRLRRQRISGQARGGFVDLVVGERVVCCGLGRGFAVGKIDAELSANVQAGNRFTIAD